MGSRGEPWSPLYAQSPRSRMRFRGRPAASYSRYLRNFTRWLLLEAARFGIPMLVQSEKRRDGEQIGMRLRVHLPRMLTPVTPECDERDVAVENGGGLGGTLRTGDANVVCVSGG